MFHVYGGGCPPRRSIGPKMSPVHRKILLGAPSGTWPLGFGTDGDVPVSLTHLLGERAARDREERVPSINQSRVWMEGAWVVRWVPWVVSGRGVPRSAPLLETHRVFYSRIGFGVREVIAFLGDCPLLTVGRVVR